jgi:predicted nucleic acid-binding protein
LACLAYRKLGNSKKRLGLTVTGTLGVLPSAKSLGLSSVRPLIEQLLQSGIHVGDAVVAEALELAGET